jgi:hypothetical protein
MTNARVRSLVLAAVFLNPMALAAQASDGARPTIAVSKFEGMGISGVSEGILTLLASQAAEGLKEQGYFSDVIDRSADVTVQSEIRRSEGIGQLDSKVTIQTTRQLNAQYVLVGRVVTLEIQSIAVSGTTVYKATISVHLQVADVQSNAVVYSTDAELETPVKRSTGKVVAENLDDIIHFRRPSKNKIAGTAMYAANREEAVAAAIKASSKVIAEQLADVAVTLEEAKASAKKAGAAPKAKKNE